jgi:hypothetical protein
VNYAGGLGSKKPGAIDDMLQCLKIDEDEINDLFSEETDLPKESIKWMYIARVGTTNYFSPQTFEQFMRVAWSPTKEVKIKELD